MPRKTTTLIVIDYYLHQNLLYFMDGRQASPLLLPMPMCTIMNWLNVTLGKYKPICLNLLTLRLANLHLITSSEKLA